jgi:hypothetical protein
MKKYLLTVLAFILTSSSNKGTSVSTGIYYGIKI